MRGSPASRTGFGCAAVPRTASPSIASIASIVIIIATAMMMIMPKAATPRTASPQVLPPPPHAQRGLPPGGRTNGRPPGQGAVWTGVSRVVAVGDLHGAYDEFAAILQGTGLVGPDLHWIGGQAHLVQMGDVLDRGPRAKDIFDLLRRLEAEAAAAGGRVHMLIGNHEAMALMGLSFDYKDFVSPEQFIAFVPERLRRRAETEFRRKNGPGADVKKMWAKAMPTNSSAQAAYFEFLRRDYGRWIASHDTIIRIDDTVFVHGGLNDRYAAWPFERINRTVQDELLSFVTGLARPTRVLYDSLGPLWYRDLAIKPEGVMAKELDAILAAVKAKVMVIAHTPTGGSRTLDGLSRFGGKVWIIDTGIWDGIAGRVGALIIEDGIHYTVWGKDDGSRANGPIGD
ncbi:MAG: metallophosphoesterase [Acidobacteriota bacterium]|nr:metallophosphoesterase [Acidobacteriota bacterium]